MTSMSRSEVFRRAGTAVPPRWGQRSLWRHASCILLALGVSGCLYWRPIVRQSDNRPPALVIPSEQEAAAPILVSLESLKNNRFIVLASDPDMDDFRAVWRLGAFDMEQFDQQTDQVEEGKLFTIVLPANPAFDQQRLTVSLIDAQLEVTVVVWELSVPRVKQ